MSVLVLGLLVILFMSRCPEPEPEQPSNPYYFTENFNDGEADDFFDDETGNWSAVDDAYQMTGQNIDSWSYSYYNHLFTNFFYTLDIKQTGGIDSIAYGFCFRSPSGDFQNGYLVSISSAGSWNLGKHVDGSFSFITSGWVLSSNINIGLNTTNTLEVVCAGSYITVQINGVTEGTYLDTSFTSGYCGVSGYDRNTCTFTYDNFSVFIE